MKRCPDCGISKPLTDFHRSGLRRDGRQSICKSCRAALDAERYARTRGTEARRRVKREFDHGRTAWLRSLKAGQSCADCHTSYAPEAMQWDHLPRFAKRGDISELSGLSKEEILKEIAKCELVCTNCHILRTAGRAGWKLREADATYAALAA